MQVHIKCQVRNSPLNPHQGHHQVTKERARRQHGKLRVTAPMKQRVRHRSAGSPESHWGVCALPHTRGNLRKPHWGREVWKTLHQLSQKMEAKARTSTIEGRTEGSAWPGFCDRISWVIGCRERAREMKMSRITLRLLTRVMLLGEINTENGTGLWRWLAQYYDV